MLVVPQYVNLKWNPRNKNYYVSKGYKYTKMKDEFKINVEDLKERENVLVKIICDYCGKLVEKPYFAHVGAMNHPIKKDTCKKCHIRKIEESNLLKYGVKNQFQREDIKNKIIKNSLLKYGVSSPAQNEKTKKKREQTNLEKYGTKYQISSKQTREKIKKTNLEKYGNEVVFYNEDVQNKIKKTLLERYGVENPTQNKEISGKAWKKARKTMYERGTAPASSQQIYLNKILRGELNYPVDNCSLDIAFINEKIYVEYDGGAHGFAYKCGFITKEEFDRIELKRNYFLKKLGWKRIRIISNKDLLPSDNMIIKLVQEAKDYLKSNHSWYHINIDESFIECSQFKRDIDLGKLRKIK